MNIVYAISLPFQNDQSAIIPKTSIYTYTAIHSSAAIGTFTFCKDILKKKS